MPPPSKPRHPPAAANDAPAAWMAPPLSKDELTEDSIHEAIERYTWMAPPDPAAEEVIASSPVRLYCLGEVRVILGVFAAASLMLESEGLLSWARRMEVGPTQSGWLAALEPIHAALEPWGVTRPRQMLVSTGDRLARALGAGEDPLLAGGWQKSESAPESEDASAVATQDTEDEVASRQRTTDTFKTADAAETAADASADEVAEGAGSGKPEPDMVPTVLLMGDSMIAGSLGGTIAASLTGHPKSRVVRAFQTATGLSRSDLFDWMKVVPPLLEREKPQYVVCSIGANDATNIRDGERLLFFGRTGWRKAYGERVVAMMRLLAGKNSKVLWLGLPPMRESSFSERARYLNRIFAQAAKEVPRVEYLDLDMLVSGPNGDYATFIRSDGRFVRARMDDGIHYSPPGAKAIARWVVDWIYERRGQLTNASP